MAIKKGPHWAGLRIVSVVKTRLHAGPRCRAGVIIQAHAQAAARDRCAGRLAGWELHGEHARTTTRPRRRCKREPSADSHAD